MSGEADIYAWDYDNDAWVKVVVNAGGEIIVTTA